MAAGTSLKGGGPRDNAAILLNILEGKEKGPMRDAALLNAAAALVVGGLAGDLAEGVSLALNAVEEGKALGVLENVRALTGGVQVR